MDVLSHLEPKEVFRFFEEICRIPHPSYQEEKISDYCVEFAKERGLPVYQDALKNVVIIKEATPGYEEKEPILIQGHLDMVCEQEKGRNIDFDTEPLQLAVDGDYIYAKGTTLGGDDGIAIAYALAVLDSDTIAHPRLEVIFTVSEEVGMDGAAGIDLSMLQGNRLLNIDSEEEGILLAGCAGGMTVECMLDAVYESRQGIAMEVMVTGLPGGHSGTEIGKCLANANILMGRFLSVCAEKLSFGLISLQGGLKGNAIPRESIALLCIEEKDKQELCSLAAEYHAIYKKEWGTENPDIQLSCREYMPGSVSAGGEQGAIQASGRYRILDRETTRKFLLLLRNLPNGVQKMSAEIPDMVETSLNLGIMKAGEEKVLLHYSIRSSVKSEKEELLQRIQSLAGYVGAAAEVSGEYPAWEYKKDSKLRERMIAIYQELFGKKPEIATIHAGLECGILAEKIRDMDAVSFGPDIYDIHTPKERMSISSVKRTWEYLIRILEDDSKEVL